MIHKQLLKTALMTSALVAIASGAHAAGTAPGTNISNSIDLSYTSGGDTISRPNAASVAFVVDRKIDFVFETQVAGGVLFVEQGAENEYLVFRLENEGNSATGYDIDVTPAPGNTLELQLDNTQPLPKGKYQVLIGTDPTPGHAGDVVYDPTADRNIGDVDPDTARYIKIVANVADSADDADRADFAIAMRPLEPGNAATSPVFVAQSTNPALDKVDTIYADNGRDGSESAESAYVVQAPQLTGSKSAVVISENLDGSFNCATGLPQGPGLAAVPGSCMEYTISVTNATGASVAATNLKVEDILPADVTYATAAKGDFDSVSVVAGAGTDPDKIVADLASLAEGATASFTIRVTID